MASEAPDPSSSELLTDFDIADVDNWDDQNDSSKDIKLVKASVPYVPSPTNPQLTSSIQSPSITQSHMTIGSPSSIYFPMNTNISNQHLGATSPPLTHLSAEGHDSPKASICINAEALHQSQQRTGSATESGQTKQPQTGQALETLRALVLAQEEQARKLKETREKALQLQQQPKAASDSTPQVANPTLQVNQLAGNSSCKQVCIPLTSLKLPISDPKNNGGKGNSVLQLRGQLMKTPNQKLMLVTEVAGKRVGYLICPQSGQLQTASMAVTSQTVTTPTQGNPQAQSPLQIIQSVRSPVTSTSLGSSSPSYPVLKVSSPVAGSTFLERDSSETVTLAQEVSPSSAPAEKQGCVTVSSDDDEDSSLSEVAASLQSTHLQAKVPVEKKKKRGRPKKKKDKNEPVKPISPYLMFFKDVQLKVRQENPKAGLGEVSKMISKLWEQATKEEKEVYLNRSAKEKEEYRIKLAEYKAKIGEAGEGSIQPVAQSPLLDSEASMDTTHNSPGSSTMEKGNQESADGYPITSLVVLSSDSSPDKGGVGLSPGATSSLQPTAVQSPLMDVDDEPMTAPAPVRKRGRPRTRNLPSDTQKEPKKNKKKEKAVIEDKPTPKLTMKINIRNSQITESPTKALEDLTKSFSEEPDEEKPDDDESDEDPIEQPKPTQPKALINFKIPLKKNRSTASTDQKEGNEIEANSQAEKISAPSIRKCANSECEKPAKISKERGPLYCSSRCLVSHCRDVFNLWVDERKEELTKDGR